MSITKQNSLRLFVLPAGFTLGKIILFFQQNPNIMLLWDWPGHLQKSQQLSWIPWENGWDTTFWGGYSTQLYPWMYHLLLKAAIVITGSQYYGALAVTLLSASLFIFGVWLVTAALDRHPLKRFFTAVAMLGVFLYAGGGLLGSFLGTVYTGGGPALLGSALWLIFLTQNRWSAQAALLGTIILTHPPTALVALLSLGIKLFLAYRQRDLLALKTSIFTLIGATVIGLPWILSMLDPANSTGALNLGVPLPLAYWLVGAVVLIVAINARQWRHPLVILTLILTLLSGVTPETSDSLQRVGVRGIHFYRFSWYSSLTAALALGHLLPEIKLRRGSVLAALITIALAFFLSPQPRFELKASWNLQLLKSLSGRILDVSRHAVVFQVPHAIEHLAAQSQLVGTNGLFFESANSGLLYYQLKNSVDPYSHKNGTMKLYLNNANNQPHFKVDKKSTSDLLGINFLAFTSVAPPPAEPELISDKAGSLELINADGSKLVADYYLERVSTKPLVEVLAKSPLVDPNIDLGQWWFDTDRTQRVIREEVETPPVVDYSAASITDINIGPTKITFRVNSSHPAPLILKFTYSPYWQAVSTHEVTQPVWVTPGQMFLWGTGEITLTWRTPRYLQLFSPFAVATWLGLVAITIRSQIQALRQPSGLRIYEDSPNRPRVKQPRRQSPPTK